MKILVLSKDKISQNMFRSQVKNLADFCNVGTHSNQTTTDLKQRLDFAATQPNTIFFHALKKSFFVTPPEWLPEPVADYQKILFEECDAIIYTKTLFQGGGYVFLKGSLESSGLLIQPE